ncbi:hypothetical protein [Tardiphaga robiniae]|uniref:Uncharacterized protein n=1 Tax=Tardiphaga robiniae TaxID=943830 RepID=A0A7G6TTE6_9BRAD|nr:hypothetical protein [Tardiphaga robiniae]QND70028.1 hypothetical protein HB776_01330 [Tardiphaga robiniae]
MKRSFIFSSVAAVSVVIPGLIIWFVLDADPHLNQTDAATSTALPSKTLAPEPSKPDRAANRTTARILALDEGTRRDFWTFVLKNEKHGCDVVVRVLYQGGTKSGVDSWSIGCQDSNEYSISVHPDAQDSKPEFSALACNGRAFVKSSE